MNHMSEKDCHKFVEEVSAVGLDLKPYVYGEYIDTVPGTYIEYLHKMIYY